MREIAAQWLPKWSVKTGVCLILIMVCLLVTPVIFNQFIPLHDYPFHLARIVILANLDNPAYHEFYQLGSFLLPNMAMDMVAVPLASVVGAETASRIFVMLSILSMLFGTLLLHKVVHKRFSPWPFLAVVFLFNGIFRYGFLNYIFGLGIAFCAAALWLSMKSGILRITIALLLSVLLIALHFAAFAVFAVIVGSCEIYTASQGWRNKEYKASIIQLFISATPFLLAIALFLIVSPTASGTGEELRLMDFVQYKTLDRLALGAMFSLLTGIIWLDVLLYSLLIIIFSFCLVKRRVTIAPNLLLALCIMTVIYIVLPFSLMGSLFADVRLLPAIALLWVASIDVKKNQNNSDQLVSAVALVLCVLISVGVTKQWARDNKEIAIITGAFEQVEIGATIFSATAEPYPGLIKNSKERRAAWAPPVKHITSYAVLSGPKFVPMTFVDPTKQPLNVTDKYQSIKAFQTDNPRKTYTATELEKFILEIRQHLSEDEWPALENVYLWVSGFDLVENNFNMSVLGAHAQVTDVNNKHVLIKLQ